MHANGVGGWVDYSGQPISSYLKNKLPVGSLTGNRNGLTLARGPGDQGLSQLVYLFRTLTFSQYTDDPVYVICQKDPHVVPGKFDRSNILYT